MWIKESLYWLSNLFISATSGQKNLVDDPFSKSLFLFIEKIKIKEVIIKKED